MLPRMNIVHFVVFFYLLRKTKLFLVQLKQVKKIVCSEPFFRWCCQICKLKEKIQVGLTRIIDFVKVGSLNSYNHTRMAA